MGTMFLPYSSYTPICQFNYSKLRKSTVVSELVMISSCLLLFDAIWWLENCFNKTFIIVAWSHSAFISIIYFQSNLKSIAEGLWHYRNHCTWYLPNHPAIQMLTIFPKNIFDALVEVQGWHVKQYSLSLDLHPQFLFVIWNGALKGLVYHMYILSDLFFHLRDCRLFTNEANQAVIQLL